MQIEQVYEEFLMKMEVLSVQNHIQGQFGVIGSTKVKDWSSPLTPPPPPPPPLPPTQQQQQQQQQQSNQPPQHSNISANGQMAEQAGAQPPARARSRSRSTTPTTSALSSSYNNKLSAHQQTKISEDGGADIVDGRLSTTPKAKFVLPPQQTQQQQQQRQAQPQPPAPQQTHYYYHNHQNFASAVAAVAAQPPPNGQAKITLSSTAGTATPAVAAAYSYNNNILYCGDATMGIAAMEASPMVQTPTSTSDMFIDTNAINELSQRLQAELRTAKSRHLSCTEVSIPWDLTPRIAAEIIRMSEREPCGIRGCTIFIEFEDEPNNIRRIASFKMDPNTVSTFELYLTLKQDKSGWTSLLPQFLKNLTRSSTIMISPDFTLTKNKLYSGE